jgi:predicted amidohydrolase YtcJ
MNVYYLLVTLFYAEIRLFGLSYGDNAHFRLTSEEVSLITLPTIFYNGTIYTVSQSLSITSAWVDTMVVNTDGIIEHIGAYDDVIAKVSTQSYQLYNLNQQLVLPGFHDVHLHAVEAGINEQLCYIEPDTPARNLARVLQGCQRDRGKYIQLDNDWIMAAGVDIGLLLETIYTNANAELPITILDRAYPNTPIVIIDSIGHGAVVNTAAIDRAKQINPDFESDYGGKVLRDPDTMEYYGIVTESTQQIFRSMAFTNKSTKHQQIAYDSLLSALTTLNANGITSVSDAGGFWQQAQTEAWQRALSENKLSVRARYESSVYIFQYHFVCCHSTTNYIRHITVHFLIVSVPNKKVMLCTSIQIWISIHNCHCYLSYTRMMKRLVYGSIKQRYMWMAYWS